MTTTLLFDSETSRKEEPEIIEAAWLFLPESPILLRAAKLVDPEWVRLKPSHPIELGALATHHILDEDLEGCDPSAMFELPECDFLVAHNVDFDWNAAGSPPGPKRICTLALARHVWPDLDSHKLGALIYHLDRQNARRRLKDAHGAAADVLLCLTVLAEIIALTGVQTWEQLWQLSEKARIPQKMPWGKHFGVPIKDLPKDYVAWCLRLPDLDCYLRIALGGQPKEKLLFCPQ